MDTMINLPNFTQSTLDSDQKKQSISSQEYCFTKEHKVLQMFSKASDKQSNIIIFITYTPTNFALDSIKLCHTEQNLMFRQPSSLKSHSIGLRSNITRSIDPQESMSIPANNYQPTRQDISRESMISLLSQKLCSMRQFKEELPSTRNLKFLPEVSLDDLDREYTMIS